LNRNQSPIANLRSQVCDLCGAAEAQFVLATPRLDGPLVRCGRCHLCYVIAPPVRAKAASAEFSFAGEVAQADAEMQRLDARAHELELIDAEVEERETRWREMAAAERLADLQRFVGGGKLLEVGCSTGELLAAAHSSFTVTGIEANAVSSRAARERGLNCLSGTLFDARFPDQYFDVAALYHVIEHLPSPRCALDELRRLLRPGGWLVIETPNIATPWFRLLGARWRQLIPDHRFFFTPETLRRLCAETGFEVIDLRSVGKAMSVRLFLSRLGRYYKPLSRVLATISEQLRADDCTLRLNLGDVMRLYARRPEQ
jgi:2-polyprenyl-3-methyl-5-hydroxy-6-metoxy-1,4-benzoquinol methylase